AAAFDHQARVRERGHARPAPGFQGGDQRLREPRRREAPVARRPGEDGAALDLAGGGRREVRVSEGGGRACGGTLLLQACLAKDEIATKEGQFESVLELPAEEAAAGRAIPAPGARCRR